MQPLGLALLRTYLFKNKQVPFYQVAPPYGN